MATGKSTFTAVLLCMTVAVMGAGDPYIFYDWNVTYGTLAPLGVPKHVILINEAFPGPVINCTSNNNIVINVFNRLDEPLLFTWSGVQLRKNSWMDGTSGTMCPIQPGTNFTYRFQVKEQIGTYYYFPTTAMHKAAGGVGVIQVHSRPLIPVPFDSPANEFAIVVGDWYNEGHKTLKRLLDGGSSIGKPDGLHINGKSYKVGEAVEPSWIFEVGKMYRFRVCNTGLRTSVNFRVQGHSMKLVELEGSHTMQNIYGSIDLHVGQCMSVLVTANKEPKDYYFVVSSRFTKDRYYTVATIRYAGSNGPVSHKLPPAPVEKTVGIVWSMNQFRTFRWNLSASAACPDPQGSYHYGNINITRTIKLVNGRNTIDGKLRFTINGVSHIDRPTPLKFSEYFGVTKHEFQYNIMADEPSPDVEKSVRLAPNVLNATFRNFVEIIFENRENSLQSYHLDGYSFFAVAVGPGRWSPEKRKHYNLEDAVSRHTVPVYPGSWAAVMIAFDNAGMWNLRSEVWDRFYLGQQLYISVLSPERSGRDEYDLQDFTQRCGIVTGLPKPPPYT